MDAPTVEQRIAKLQAPKKPRIDGQLTALAGELFVAAELLRRLRERKVLRSVRAQPPLGKIFHGASQSAAQKHCFLISPKEVDSGHVKCSCS